MKDFQVIQTFDEDQIYARQNGNGHPNFGKLGMVLAVGITHNSIALQVRYDNGETDYVMLGDVWESYPFLVDAGTEDSIPDTYQREDHKDIAKPKTQKVVIAKDIDGNPMVDQDGDFIFEVRLLPVQLERHYEYQQWQSKGSGHTIQANGNDQIGLGRIVDEQGFFKSFLSIASLVHYLDSRKSILVPASCHRATYEGRPLFYIQETKKDGQ